MKKQSYPTKIRFRIKKHQPRHNSCINFNFSDKRIGPTEILQSPNQDENESLKSLESTEINEMTDNQKQIVKKWINDNLSIIKTINKRNTVFEIIYIFELIIKPDFKITPDQLSSCMLECGFRIENGRFNVSGVSIKKLTHIVEKIEKLRKYLRDD